MGRGRWYPLVHVWVGRVPHPVPGSFQGVPPDPVSGLSPGQDEEQDQGVPRSRGTPLSNPDKTGGTHATSGQDMQEDCLVLVFKGSCANYQITNFMIRRFVTLRYFDKKGLTAIIRWRKSRFTCACAGVTHPVTVATHVTDLTATNTGCICYNRHIVGNLYASVQCRQFRVQKHHASKKTRSWSTNRSN